MRALRKLATGAGQVELCDVDEPALADSHSVKIAVEACGLCGTDLHIRDGGYGFRPPVTMGHEICGEVVEAGGEVARVGIGDRVTVNPTASGSCGNCRDCARGAYFFCPERRSLGSVLDGGFAEFVTVPEHLVFVLPESVPAEAGALVEPFACCVKAVQLLTEVAEGDTVLVCGPGPIGQMCAWLAKDAGARIYVAGTSSDEGRLAATEKLGLGKTVDVTRVDVTALIREATGGEGADVVIECAGTPGSIAQCLAAARNGAQFTQVALVDEPIGVDWGRIIYKELTVRGAIATDWASWDLTLEMVRDERVDLSTFVTHRHALADWEMAFQNADSKQGLKQIILPAP